MKKNVLSLMAALLIAALSVLVFVPVGWAADYSGNQDINQTAYLKAPNSDSKIAIYPQPGTRQPQIGSGTSGDRITILDQVSSNQGKAWNHIRFEKPPQVEGWVQEDYISLEPASQTYSGQQSAQTSGQNKPYAQKAQKAQKSGQNESYAQKAQNNPYSGQSSGAFSGNQSTANSSPYQQP